MKKVEERTVPSLLRAKNRRWKDRTACWKYLHHRPLFLFFFFFPPLLSFLLLFFFLFLHALSRIEDLSSLFFYSSPLLSSSRDREQVAEEEEERRKGLEGWGRLNRDKTNALFGTRASLLFTLHLFYFIFRGINVFGGFASRLGKYFHNTCLLFPTNPPTQRTFLLVLSFPLFLSLSLSRSSFSFLLFHVLFCLRGSGGFFLPLARLEAME